MTRLSRVYYNNAIYHISIRGNNKQFILQEDEDKIMFLRSLEKFRRRFDFKLYCFVIMNNHAHLIIKAANAVDISKIMQAITLSYSVKFRKKYNYTGYVWQGRFKSSIIEEDKYILRCIDYIHNNPIRAKIINKIEDYIWSSYRFYQGLGSKINNYIGIEKVNN